MTEHNPTDGDEAEAESDVNAFIEELVRAACGTALDNAGDMGLHGEDARDHLRVHWRGYIYHEAEAVIEEDDWAADFYETPLPDRFADSVDDLERLAIARAPMLVSEDDDLPALYAPVLASEDDEPRPWSG